MRRKKTTLITLILFKRTYLIFERIDNLSLVKLFIPIDKKNTNIQHITQYMLFVPNFCYNAF